MLEKIRNLVQFFQFPSHARTISVLAVLVLLAAVPLTVFIGSQQQEIRQHASEGSAPIGFLDSASCVEFKGWTCDPADYSQGLRLDFYIDGPAGSGQGLETHTIASQSRESGVAGQCGGNANHGFIFNPTYSSTFRQKFMDGNQHTIYAYGIGVNNRNSNTLLVNQLTFKCTSETSYPPPPSTSTWNPPACTQSTFIGCSNAGQATCSDKTGAGADGLQISDSGIKSYLAGICQNVCSRNDLNSMCTTAAWPNGTIVLHGTTTPSTGPYTAVVGQTLTFDISMQNTTFVDVPVIQPPDGLSGDAMDNWWLGLTATTNNNTYGKVDSSIPRHNCNSPYCLFSTTWTPTNPGTYYVSILGPNLGEYACGGNLGMHHGKNSAILDAARWKVCSTNQVNSGGGAGFADMLIVNVSSPTTSTTPSNSTLALNLKLGAIGATGENTNPRTIQRNIVACLYPNSVDPTGDNDCTKTGAIKKTGNVTYTNTNGKFANASFDLGTITTGPYRVCIKTDRYLRKCTGSFLNIGAGVTQVPETALVPGDINGDNHISILDYNIIFDCFVNNDGTTPQECGNHTQNEKQNADLDDNGIVNEVDYNIFIANLSTKDGD